MSKEGHKRYIVEYDAKQSCLITTNTVILDSVPKDSFIIFTERIIFTDDDRKHRPLCVMETAGPYFNESVVNRVWLAMIDIEKFEIVEQMEFRFQSKLKIDHHSCQERLSIV